jgi:hypothetical protein
LCGVLQRVGIVCIFYIMAIGDNVGGDMRELKNPDILKKRPNLELCSNHYRDEVRPLRVWRSRHVGTAYADGRGWYVDKNGVAAS